MQLITIVDEASKYKNSIFHGYKWSFLVTMPWPTNEGTIQFIMGLFLMANVLKPGFVQRQVDEHYVSSIWNSQNMVPQAEPAVPQFN